MHEILTIHYKLVEQTGGSHGVRDLNALESVENRPQSGAFGSEFYETLPLKAAAIMHSLIHFHPFVDGNKRTGMVAGISFLRMNGLDLDVVSQDLEDYAVHVATSDASVEEIAEWIESSLVRFSG